MHVNVLMKMGFGKNLSIDVPAIGPQNCLLVFWDLECRHRYSTTWS